MRADDLAKRGVQQVRRGVIAAGGLASSHVDLGRHRLAERQLPRLETNAMDDETFGRSLHIHDLGVTRGGG